MHSLALFVGVLSLKTLQFPNGFLPLQATHGEKLAMLSVRTFEEESLVVALHLVTSSVLGLNDVVRMRSCASGFYCNYSLNSTNDVRDQCRLTTCIAQASFMSGGNFAIACLKTDVLSSSE